MKQYRLTYRHSYLGLDLEPTIITGWFDKYGEQVECVHALKDDFQLMQEDVAEDGTEEYVFMNIAHILEEEDSSVVVKSKKLPIQTLQESYYEEEEYNDPFDY